MAATIRKMSNTGDSNMKAETSFEAARIINEHRKSGGWAFLDGKMVNTNEVTEQDIEDTDDVVLAPPVKGG